MVTEEKDIKPGQTDNLQKVIKEIDSLYEPYLRSSTTDPYHTVFEQFCKQCADHKDFDILEIGSRESGGLRHRSYFKSARSYTGFDFHAGPGVDVVGDAHELSKYFPPASFDAVFSVATFEHFAFPWKVVLEMNQILRVGGLCHVSTVHVWPPHELPWDFWRFPLAGLKVLFSDATGFKLHVACEGIPARVHSLADDAPTRGIADYELPLAVAIIAEKTKDYDHDRLRWDVPLDSVVESIYPEHYLPHNLKRRHVRTKWDRVISKIRRIFKKP
jgi:SAM-dependent methyltransferase